ncbi:helix-turn-helix domain-containing protein [Moraxella equi]|uniref:HTH-type transcriptional regulator immR n=1 Tax=Moraxella equi TaxID=60442 RepID=A0A378QRX7_9GAMM|nr:helix-turn-helix transcriptional regulator [Moraxella equi]OPH35996.1 hypothetical protein B5J93_09935 [Moraxella equi]STZ03649.1 HTH-type transcriptional regulator immR [Moraxella equi]
MKNEKNIEFGNRLRQVRTSHNLVRQEFAQSLGIGLTSLHHYENGERLPDVGFLIKLQDLYNVDINWLVLGQSSTEQTDYTADDLRLINHLKALNPQAKQALLAFLDNLEK